MSSSIRPGWLLLLAILAFPAMGERQASSGADAQEQTQDAASDLLARPGAAAGAATPSDALVEQESQKNLRDDTRTTALVAGKLSRRPDLQDVQVAVNAGVATLSGTVVTDSGRELAESLAASVPGVIAVENQVDLSAQLKDRIGPVLEEVQQKLLRLVASLPLLLIAILVLVVFSWLGRWLSNRLHLLRMGSGNPYLDGLVRQGVRFALLLVGILIALDLLGATALVGAVLGSAGVLGIVLGFAFRDLAENQLSGVLLSLRRPFEPGDHIVVDGHEGRVISLNSRSTILMTLDGNHLRLPNAMVFKGVMLNYTRNPMRRLTFSIGIGTGEDLTQARRLAVETLRAMPAVSVEPPPLATIKAMGDSSVTIDFHAWLDQRQVDFLKTRSEAIRLVKRALEDAGMDMPEPIYRVHLVGGPDAGTRAGAAASGAVTDGGEPAALPEPSVTSPRATDGTQALKPEGRPEELEQEDVSVSHELDGQIANERALQEGEDLLRHPARKE